MTMTMEILILIQRYGYTGKLVRAVCALHGWPYTSNGAPAEWYEAYRSGRLGL